MRISRHGPRVYGQRGSSTFQSKVDGLGEGSAVEAINVTPKVGHLYLEAGARRHAAG